MLQKLIRILAGTFVCMLMLFASAGALADGLEVHFLSVGRNDGILIRCGGEDVFIDSGGYAEGRICTEYMKNVGVEKLKYYIGTHAHSDHVGGAPIIIDAFRPDAIYQPHDKVKQVIIENIRNAGSRAAVRNANYVNITVGQQIAVGGATLRCLGPVKVRNLNPAWGTENENSLVFMLTYGETDILLTGDATSNTLLAMDAADPGCLMADVYKNAHHNEYTVPAVFSRIQPQYTVFCTAKRKLPGSAYLRLLNQYQSVPLSTGEDHCGTIILRSDGSEIEFSSQQRVEEVVLKAGELQVYEGKTVKVNAKVSPSGRARLLLYSSSDPSVATVDANGKVTGVSGGEAVITLRDGMGAFAECRVTVSPATVVMKKSAYTVRQHARVSVGYKLQPAGTKIRPVWSSADPSIATVDAKGRVTGVYPGETVITATMPSGQKASVPVTVTPVSVRSVKISPSSVKMTLGDSKTVAAKVSPSKATWPEVTWTSADESIVTVDGNGCLRAVGVGQTTITATTREGKSRTARVTVNPVYVKKILLSGRTSGLVGGVAGRNQVQLSCEIQPANATIKDVVWISSNKKVAVVDENGVVTGLKAGKVTITCKAADGSKRYAKIKLTFGANELKQTVKPVNGELIAAPSRMRYVSGQLEVRMTFRNRTGASVQIPGPGVLMLVTPEGEQIPLMPLAASRQYTLRNKDSRTIRYRVPVGAQTAGLDLTRSGAVISGAPVP